MVRRVPEFALALALVLAVVLPPGVPSAQQVSVGDLAPTRHPAVPSDVSQLWMAPGGARREPTPSELDLVSAIRLQSEKNFAKALEVLSQPTLREGVLAGYADYFQ